MKAIVVEDTGVAQRAVLHDLPGLSLSNDEIREATDGHDSVKAILTEAFCVTLVDCDISDALGLEIIRLIREHTLPFPILLVTRREKRLYAVESIRGRALNYLVKPIYHQSMLEKVLGILPERPES